MSGRLAGIARHGRKYGPIEILAAVRADLAGGVTGDYPSAVASRKTSRKRQVSLIERESWEVALAEVGASLDWQQSRRNFLFDGLRLPRAVGTRLQIGSTLVIEITDECTPCHRMDALRPGLFDTTKADWRGGFVARIEQGGEVSLGDEIRIL